MASKIGVFKYDLDFFGILKSIEYEITFPIKIEIDEIIYEIINKYNLMDSFFEKIYNELNKFIDKQQKEIYISKFGELSNTDHNDIALYWESLYNTQCSNFVVNIPKFDDIIKFSKNFKKLLSVSRKNDFIKMVTGYRKAIDEFHDRRKNNLIKLRKEYNDTVKSAKLTSIQITEIYREKIKGIKDAWQKTIIEQMKLQKEEFRSWVGENHSSQGEHMETPAVENKRISVSKNKEMNRSFFFKFGNQLKHTHNINIYCTSIPALFQISSECDFYQQTLLNNMLSIYTQNLSCLVLLTDGEVPSQIPAERSLKNVCLRNTEFHFPTYFEQHEAVINELSKSMHCLESGDCYITIHSNLSSVQIIFHLIYKCESMTYLPLQNDPQITGLKNAIELCVTNGLTSILIPLLLVYEYTPEMIFPWCLKRADMMLKCLKSIIVDMTVIAHSQLSFDLFLPKDTPSDIFEAICNLIEESYTSNTINLTKYM